MEQLFYYKKAWVSWHCKKNLGPKKLSKTSFSFALAPGLSVLHCKHNQVYLHWLRQLFARKVWGHQTFLMAGESNLETKPGGKIKAELSWTAFLCTVRTPTATEVVKKNTGRWAIEVFFIAAKEHLALGQEKGQSLASQAFWLTHVFFSFSLLACLEQDDQTKTIHNFVERLRRASPLSWKPFQIPLAIFIIQVMGFGPILMLSSIPSLSFPL
jgi:hypothetical protein